MIPSTEFSEQSRTLGKILTLYYLENFSQADIAARLGLSVAKVNRLLKLARQSGMVEVTLHIPHHSLLDLENQLGAYPGLEDVLVTPAASGGSDGEPGALAQAAAGVLAARLAGGDTLCIGGGKTLYEVAHQVDLSGCPGCAVVPAMGGVQRKHETDVNGLAAGLAARIGGTPYQFYAPAYADTSEEKDTLFGLSHVSRALELARGARVGLFGIGSLDPGATYFQYTSLPEQVLMDLIAEYGGVGEVLGRVINAQGQECIPQVSERVVGISLAEMKRMPVRIGVASGERKGPVAAAAIRGGIFTTLVLDEPAARSALQVLSQA